MIKEIFDFFGQPSPRDAIALMELAIAAFIICWSIVFWPFEKSVDKPRRKLAVDPSSPQEASPAETDQGIVITSGRNISPEEIQRYEGSVNSDTFDAQTQTPRLMPRRTEKDVEVDPEWRAKIFSMLLDEPTEEMIKQSIQEPENAARAAPG